MKHSPGFNHFVPVWRRAALGTDRCNQMKKALDVEFKTLLQSPDLSMMIEPSDVLALSRMHLMKEQLQHLGNFQALQDWLGERIASNVPGDGNCAIWSVLSLIDDNPFLQPNQEANTKLRQEIAAHWLSVLDDSAWQRVYAGIVNPFDDCSEKDVVDDVEIVSENITGPFCDQVHKNEPKREQKSERISPPRRRLKQPEFVDLTTPPKKGTQPEPDKGQEKKGSQKVQPEIVGASRPAFQRKNFAEEEKPLEHLGMRAQASRKLGKLLDDDHADPGDDQNGDPCEDGPEEEGQQPAKKRRRRTCKVKQPTLEERRIAAAKAYLGSVGVTWQRHQGFHSRFAVASSEYKCVAYRKMVAKLMEGEFPSCLTCTSMLTQHRFNMDTFQGRLQEASADPSLPSPATNQISNLLQGLSLQYPLDGNLDLIPLQDAPAADGEAAGTAGHNFEAALYSNWLVYKMQWGHMGSNLPNLRPGWTIL